MSDAAEIARGLSPARKRALLWLHEDGSWTVKTKRWPLRGSPLCVAATSEGFFWRLTPLGLAVRSVLAKEAPDAA